jgi:hypothetical protein
VAPACAAQLAMFGWHDLKSNEGVKPEAHAISFLEIRDLIS